MNSIYSLFAQKSWANNELFNVLATVTAQEHTDALHSAIRMLNHIYVVDRIFQSHLLSEQHGYSATNTDATPGLDELQFAVAETDAWYESYARKACASQLEESITFRFTDGDAGTMTRQEMLLHVITHGAYHRGNVGQMLKLISVAPPRDLYTKFLHVSEPARRRA
ncbi:MAG: damage-inducible protein DinB [Actinobacteria bacterium]|nr:damage-inducible protein DinB [Actinomycetota bacterium]